MMAMAVKGRRDQRPEKSISRPQMSAMMARMNPRVSVMIDEPPCIQVSVSQDEKCRGGDSNPYALVGPRILSPTHRGHERARMGNLSSRIASGGQVKALTLPPAVATPERSNADDRVQSEGALRGSSFGANGAGPC
jgi:hypothetical protein